MINGSFFRSLREGVLNVDSMENREIILKELLEQAKDDESWEPDPALRAQLTQMLGMFLLTQTG